MLMREKKKLNVWVCACWEAGECKKNNVRSIIMERQAHSERLRLCNVERWERISSSSTDRSDVTQSSGRVRAEEKEPKSLFLPRNERRRKKLFTEGFSSFSCSRDLCAEWRHTASPRSFHWRRFGCVPVFLFSTIDSPFHSNVAMHFPSFSRVCVGGRRAFSCRKSIKVHIKTFHTAKVFSVVERRLGYVVCVKGLFVWKLESSVFSVRLCNHVLFCFQPKKKKASSFCVRKNKTSL